MSDKDTILIVDDLPDNVEILQELLEDDFNLVVAYSGQECLEKLKGARPDIVLLDVMMPDINGYDVCRRIRAIPECFDIKIIFVSAKAQLKEKLEGYTAGADDYIIKPFEKDCVMAKVKVFSKMVAAEKELKKKVDLLGRVSSRLSEPLQKVQECGAQLKGAISLDAKQQGSLADIVKVSRGLLGMLQKARALNSNK